MAKIAVYVYHYCADCQEARGGRTIIVAQAQGRVQSSTTKRNFTLTKHCLRYQVMVLSTYIIIATITLQTLKLVERYLQLGEQQHHSSWPGPHFLLPRFCAMHKQYHRRVLC